MWQQGFGNWLNSTFLERNWILNNEMKWKNVNWNLPSREINTRSRNAPSPRIFPVCNPWKKIKINGTLKKPLRTLMLAAHTNSGKCVKKTEFFESDSERNPLPMKPTGHWRAVAAQQPITIRKPRGALHCHWPAGPASPAPPPRPDMSTNAI